MSLEFKTIATTDQIPPGAMVAFDVAGRRLAVANVGGTFYAFDDTCTHAECSLADGMLTGTTVVCPCHFGEFDVRTGEILSPPPTEPVQTYPVRVEGRSIQIAIA